MPIANCFLTHSAARIDVEAVVSAWSNRSGIDATEMTVNFVSQVHQGGKRYAAMTWLYLPSLWSDQDVQDLGEGLAEALAEALNVETGAIQVITTIVDSGMVVESGETLRW